MSDCATAPISERIAAMEVWISNLTTSEEMGAQGGGWSYRAQLFTNQGRAQLLALLREAKEALRNEKEQT